MTLSVLNDGRVLLRNATDGYWYQSRDWRAGPFDLIASEFGGVVYPADDSFSVSAVLQIGNELVSVSTWFNSGVPMIALGFWDVETLALNRMVETAVPWSDFKWNEHLQNGGTVAFGYHNGRFFVEDYYDMHVFDSGGALVSSFRHGYEPLGNYVMLNIDGKMAMFISTGFGVVIDANTLEETGDYVGDFLPPIDGGIAGAAFTSDSTLLIRQGGAGAEVLREIATRDVVISATGNVTTENGQGLLRAVPRETIAAMNLTRESDGRVTASGELLRAVLELYTGRTMPPNYLDYIYRVRADNLNGIAPRTIDSGGRSFQASEIADDATATFPQTIELTIREGLL